MTDCSSKIPWRLRRGYEKKKEGGNRSKASGTNIEKTTKGGTGRWITGRRFRTYKAAEINIQYQMDPSRRCTHHKTRVKGREEKYLLGGQRLEGGGGWTTKEGGSGD